MYKILLQNHEDVVSKRILRSGTSIRADAEEATVVQTRMDFISRMSVGPKDARKTKCWLRLFSESQLSEGDRSCQIKEVEGMIEVLTFIVNPTQEEIQDS